MHTVSRHMWEIITALLYMQRNCYKPLIELSEWKGFVAWSKGRHFSPSLHGDRYLKLGFQSDLRAEISGSIVWYDALAPRPEALLSCCFDGACTVSLEKKFLLNCKVNHKQPSHCFKHHLLVRISSTWIIRYWPVRFQVTNPLIWHLMIWHLMIWHLLRNESTTIYSGFLKFFSRQPKEGWKKNKQLKSPEMKRQRKRLFQEKTFSRGVHLYLGSQKRMRDVKSFTTKKLKISKCSFVMSR